MGNLKLLGFIAFIGTGVVMMLISAFAQTTPWVIVLVLVFAGYLFGLKDHYRKLRS